MPVIFALVANQIRALVRGLVREGYREIRRKESFYQKQCFYAFSTK